MRKILVIEDLATRVSWLITNFPKAQITWATTPDQVRYYLTNYVWDLIIWDNDLQQKTEGCHFAHDFGADAVVTPRHWIWSVNPTRGPIIHERLYNHAQALQVDPQLVLHPFDNTIPYTLREFFNDCI